MTDRKPISGAVSEVRCDTRDSERRNISDTDPEEEKKRTEDSKRKWEISSLQELEEVLHSAPRSCRHGDEVWPNLYLGDMWVSFALFNFCVSELLFMHKKMWYLCQVYVS